MKIWQCIYYLINSIILFNNIGAVNKKLQKSFDQIFGEGWEEKGQNLEDGLGDQRDGIGQCQTNAIQSDQNNYLDQINEEPTDHNENYGQSECDQKKREIIHKFRAKEFGMGRRKKIYSKKQKIKIIQKFKAMCNEYKQKGTYSTKEWDQNYAEISKKFGVCYYIIKKWKKEIGMGCKNILNDQQKQEIIQKFQAIKQKIKQKRVKYSIKEKNKIEKTILKKLGTNRTEICKWKKEFGIIHKRDSFSAQQKREIIEKFRAIKEKIKEKGIKYETKERTKIEATIAKQMNANRMDIYKWINEFGMGIIKKKNYGIYSQKQKIEIVQKFIKTCNEYKQKRKYSKKEWDQNYAKILKKLGVGYSTIHKWKKQFGIIPKRKSHTAEQKLEIMKRYWEMKRNNPTISNRKIAKALKIDQSNISRWKGEFREESI